MKPRFTDEHRYPRGYIRSESTDVGRTWAAERKRVEDAKNPPQSKVRKLKRVVSAWG